MGFFSKDTGRKQGAALPEPVVDLVAARADLLADLPRGFDPRQPPSKGATVGRFDVPSPAERKFQFMPEARPGAVYLGVVGGQPKAGPYGPYLEDGTPIAIEDDRHIMLVAGSRAGKGRAVLLPNLLTYRGSVVATDPKGELAAETACRRAAIGQSVYILDPFKTVKGKAERWRCGYNPVAAIRDDYLIEDATLLADAIVVVENPNSNRDPHWDDSARAFIEGVILHVRTSTIYSEVRHDKTNELIQPDRRTLATVRELLTVGARATPDAKPSFPMLCDDMMASHEPVVVAAAVDFFSKPEKERESVHSTVRRHTKFLDLEAIRDVTDSHDFDVEDLRTKGATVYLCLPARHMNTCSRWLRMFINLGLQNIERMGPVKRGTPPILFVLDEFFSLGHMKQLETAAAQIAGFGIRLMTVLQDLGQLEHLYGKNFETFMGNSGVLQFFGNSDLKTLDWISKRLGKTTLRIDERAPATLETTGSGRRDMPRSSEFDLLHPDEVARFFRRNDKKLRQLVFFLDEDYPLVLQRAFADTHPAFRSLNDTAAQAMP